MGSYKLLSLLSGNDEIYKRMKYNYFTSILMPILILSILFCNILDITISASFSIQLLIIQLVFTISIIGKIAMYFEKSKLLKYECSDCSSSTANLMKSMVEFESDICKKYKKSTVTINIAFYLTVFFLWVSPMSNFSSGIKRSCIIIAIVLLFAYYIVQKNRINVIKSKAMMVFMRTNHNLIEKALVELNISDDEYNRVLMV